MEELIFTSSERGLQIGKSGFCTVASTPEMAPNLTRMLESLSGYRHLFTSGSPAAAKNPVVYSFLDVKVGGEQKHILSRVADAGVDYSGRSNKIAHHISLPADSEKTGSPTRMLLDKQFFCSRWEGEPKQLQPRPLLHKASAPSPCRFWEKVTGDAGWAGELIQACQTGKVIYLIIEPTTPAAALLHEAISLLPRQKQWQTTFSSFYRRLPPNIHCQIRCVMVDSPEIEMTRQNQNNIVWDLTKPLGAPNSFLADFAREGKLITDNKRSPTAVMKEKDAADSTPAVTQAPAPDKKTPSLDKRPPELLTGGKHVEGERRTSKRSWLKLLVSILLLLGIAATFAILSIPELKDQVSSVISPPAPPAPLDNAKPIAIDSSTSAGPAIDVPPMEPTQVFNHSIPPTVLSPPIATTPDVVPMAPSTEISNAKPLLSRDISFAPRWQSFEKSRFPQPVLLVRHTTPLSDQIRLNFLGDPAKLQLIPAGKSWNVRAADRQIGTIETAEHEEGTQLEFQCKLNDSGTPTVFLDSMDLLNQSVLEIYTDSLSPTEFDISLRFVQSHIDFDNRSKQEKLTFGIGGETLSQMAAGTVVELRSVNTYSPKLSEENLLEKKNTVAQESDDADEETNQSELFIKFPIRFNQQSLEKLSLRQRERLASLNVTINLRIFVSPNKSLRYQWKSFTFVFDETKMVARSWKFEHHPIDVVTRELKRQVKAKDNGKRKSKGANDLPKQKLAVEETEKLEKIKELLEILENAKKQTDNSLELTQLMPDRLESPINLKTQNGQNYLIFIDMGKESRHWSSQEMRMSYHGATRSASN